MTPGTYDGHVIVRGTTTPFIVRFTAPIPNYDPPTDEAIPFDDVQLTISKSEGSAPDQFLVRKKLSDGDPRFFVSDPDLGEVTWLPTPAESRLLIRTKEGDPGKNYYEWELRNGPEQTVFLRGLISAIGGVNEDV